MTHPWIHAAIGALLAVPLLSVLSNAGPALQGGVPNDSDGDLLSDADEVVVYQTDPLDPDSDDDGTPDGLEVARGLDPNSAASRLDRPNIIFIMCDDLGYGDLGVLFQNSIPGTKRHFTPELDQFAASGLILDRHYCPAPVCAPSRASFFNGVHQGHASVRDNQFDKELKANYNLPNTLRTTGYSTSLIGKWGLQGSGSSPATWPAYPTKRGFDTFFGYVRHGDGHNHYPAHTTAARPNKELYDGNTNISPDLAKCYSADLFTARAKKIIVDETTNNPSRPFFICLAFDTPHAALHLPTQAYPAGDGLTGGLQWIGAPGQMINTASGTIDSYVHPDYSGHGWSQEAERFATSVRRLDDCVGDILQTLQDLSIDDNTLVVFTSDNGPHSEAYTPGLGYHASEFDSFGPFDGIKRDVWEGGIRMPTLVRWPGTIPASQVNHEPSQFHDWMSTFTDIAGWTTPARCDGVSLLPTLTGSGVQREGLVYVEYSVGGSTPSYSEFDPSHRGRARGQMQVIHLEGYKGIRVGIQSHDTFFDIYDLSADPQETNNLAGSSAYFDDLQTRMKARVLAVRQPNTTAGRPYDLALVPSVNATAEPGLDYSAYEGLWPWVPDFTEMTPVANGTASSIDTAHLSRPDDAGLWFAGYVNIPNGGLWSFKLDCDTGAHLRVHDSQVIDNDFNHAGVEVSGSIRLEAGLHPIRLSYRTASAQPGLSLKWSGPGIIEEPIPASALFRDSNQVPVVLVDWDFSTQTPPTANVPPPAPVMDANLAMTSTMVTSSDMTSESRLPTYAGLIEDPTNPAPGELHLKWWDGDLNDNPGSFNDSVNDNYLGFTVTPAGQAINVTRLSVRQWRNGSGAPETMAWTVIADGGAEIPFGSPLIDSNSGDFGFDWFHAEGSITAHSSLEIRFRPHGCCGTNGTGSLHIDGLRVAGLQASVGSPYCFGDGTGMPCPCGNLGASGEGCANSTGLGARLSATGSISAANTDLALVGSQLPPNKPALYFAGTNALAGYTFGDGLRCAGGSITRLQVVTTDALGEATSTIPIPTRLGATPGTTSYFQLWYRDPSGPCSGNFNTTSALRIDWN